MNLPTPPPSPFPPSSIASSSSPPTPLLPLLLPFPLLLLFLVLSLVRRSQCWFPEKSFCNIFSISGWQAGPIMKTLLSTLDQRVYTLLLICKSKWSHIGINPADPLFPSACFGWLVRWSVGLSQFPNNGEKMQFYAPIGAPLELRTNFGSS